MLKTYGGPQIRKKFRGLKITQTEIEQASTAKRLHSRITSIGSIKEQLSNSRSPTAKDRTSPTNNLKVHNFDSNKPQTSIQTGTKNLNATYFGGEHVSVSHGTTNKDNDDILINDLMNKVRHLEELLESLGQERGEYEQNLENLKGEKIGLETDL